MLLKDNRIIKLLLLFKAAFASHKWQIALVTALSFVSGVLEGIGVNAVIPMVSLIDSGQGKEMDVISKAIKTFFSYFGLAYTVKYLLILIVVLFVAKALVIFITQYLTAKVAADYQATTSAELFRAMLAADWPYLSTQRVGYLDQVLTTDINYASAIVTYIGTFILIFVNLAIYSLITINISPVIAVLALVSGAFVLIVFKPLFYRNKRFSDRNVAAQKELAHFVNESVIGMKTIKSLSVGERALERGAALFERMRRLFMKIVSLKIFINVAMQPMSIFFVLGVFAYFYKTNALNFVSFAVVVYAIGKVFASIQIAQSQLHILSSYVPHLVSVLKYRAEVMNRREVDTGTKQFSFRRELELRGVGFSYDGTSPTLSGVSFAVKKGTMVGLIGPSGAGKTTIVDLLLRLLIPHRGAIAMDGEDIASVSLREWRTHVGYVSQDIFLLNDTIENNIRFYDDRVSDEDIAYAVRMANVDAFINTQPNGLRTVVGERGMLLSGGQRQRIVLARALARKPDLLILDEATSALDNESEALIQDSIKALKGETTVMVVAHRLSTVAISDQLIVLESGKIIEQGAPRELLKDKQSYFSRMYNLRE